jgi:hypothetical protein
MANFKYWNYRLIRQNENSVEIYEVHYDENDKPVAYAETGPIWGETVDEVSKVIDMMREAINKPVLESEIFGAPDA